MQRYFFHLRGKLSAHDVHGHKCADDAEARDHGDFIAHRIADEKPGLIHDGSFISVCDERGREIVQFPLTSIMAH